MSTPAVTRTILGIQFFQGPVRQAVERMQHGGLLVVPAAPALLKLENDTGYREALTNADLVLPDSAFMVLVWNRLQRDLMVRLSGLAYLRELLTCSDVRRAGNSVWVMSDESSGKRHLAWLAGQGIEVPSGCVYIAPIYGPDATDATLVELLERLRPQHVLLTVGGGVQEKLGWFLKQRLSYTPSIHCVGAAIAFLSGAQVRIPVWADRWYLGWLFRSASDPARFIPRYWDARKLLILLVKYRERPPVPLPGSANY
jgi:UDP-N-acetyl-D-mannosaminuronic acid transferase (WecB/TagA/CpsF family)